jgi:hypothetical protein
MTPRAEFARTFTIATLFVVGFSGALDIAHAEVPTAGDIAACNQAAREGVQDRAVSPTSKDEVDADAARKVRQGTVDLPDGVRHGTQSPDPQIHGMDGEGAKDAAYRAAYRVCMRRSGF